MPLCFACQDKSSAVADEHCMAISRAAELRIGQQACLRLVEAKVFWPGNGGLGRRGKVLARLPPGLYLSIYALQHLQHSP